MLPGGHFVAVAISLCACAHRAPWSRACAASPSTTTASSTLSPPATAGCILGRGSVCGMYNYEYSYTPRQDATLVHPLQVPSKLGQALAPWWRLSRHKSHSTALRGAQAAFWAAAAEQTGNSSLVWPASFLPCQSQLLAASILSPGRDPAFTVAPLFPSPDYFFFFDRFFLFPLNFSLAGLSGLFFFTRLATTYTHSLTCALHCLTASPTLPWLSDVQSQPEYEYAQRDNGRAEAERAKEVKGAIPESPGCYPSGSLYLTLPCLLLLLPLLLQWYCYRSST
ncbi:hypothetical protein V8C26DRAFT_323844 [Trichoderma gracile]